MAVTSFAPASMAVYRAAVASNQPTRRGRPVTVPYSRPMRRMGPPIPPGPPATPGGNGPRPTRVVYAFTTPTMRVRCRAGTPDPDQTPDGRLCELVTYGYVP